MQESLQLNVILKGKQLCLSSHSIYRVIHLFHKTYSEPNGTIPFFHSPCVYKDLYFVKLPVCLVQSLVHMDIRH